MAALSGLILHGGIGGAIAEGLLGLAVAAIFVAVWLRERRERSNEPQEALLRDREDVSS
jgi:hypothetical protein